MPVNAVRTSQLREKVRGAYSSAAKSPTERHPFPVGRDFAESLGYPEELLAEVPSIAADAFASVSNVSVRPNWKNHWGGFQCEMLCRAREAVRQSGAANVELHEADAEQLPVEDGDIDIAMINGIFNLNPARDAIFRGLGRVMRPGGEVFVAELILSGPLPPEIKANEAKWFA